MIVRKSCSDSIPSTVAVGPTLTLYRDNVEYVTEEHEEETVSYYRYDEIAFGPGEYDGVCHGALPAGAEWDAVSHRLFRQHQHRQTDDLYSQAYRLQRTSASPEAWAEYIAALDAWNAQVSALAETFSTDVPDLPVMPTA